MCILGLAGLGRVRGIGERRESERDGLQLDLGIGEGGTRVHRMG